MERSDPRNRQRLGVTVLVALLCATLVALWPAPATAEDERPPVKVMTRNLYLGADLMAVAGASTIEEVMQAAADAWTMVKATDFPTRSRAIAREVDRTKPVLIGLQEVALWQTRPLDGSKPSTVVYDFLGILLTRLAARGLDYKVVVEQPTFDVELPTTLGLYVHLTQRNVILARADLPPGKLRLSNPRKQHFDNNLTYPVPGGGEIVDTRGWTSVDVQSQGRRFRFISTHLESFYEPIRYLQAQELLAGPVAGTMPKVLVGDMNDVPTSATLTLLRGAGLRDAWAVARRGPGYTYGQDPDLRNPTSKLSMRIDHVLASKGIGIRFAQLVGDKPFERIAGLWPSDHAGVVATLTP